MKKYLIHQILSAIPTLIGVSFLAFALIRLVPGDPVTVMLGDRGASPEIVESMRAELGLNRPWYDQYFRFLSKAASGDLGISIQSRRPVWEEFKESFPATIELTFSAMLVAISFGIPLGLWAAARKGTWLDSLSMSGSLVGYSMPIFWWGLILILIFSVRLGWTPVSGRMSAMQEIPVRTGFMIIDSLLSEGGFSAFKESLRHLILPTLALATVPMAAIARMTRATMVEILREDYIRTAKAKGLAWRTVIFKHALSNALLNIVTVIGLMGSSLLTGAILTETIFSWPGVGRWLVSSISARDYPVLQGGLLLLCVAVMAVNIFIEIVYAWINPLIRGRHG